MRIERSQHPGDRAVDETFGGDRLDVVLLHDRQHVGEGLRVPCRCRPVGAWARRTARSPITTKQTMSAMLIPTINRLRLFPAITQSVRKFAVIRRCRRRAANLVFLFRQPLAFINSFSASRISALDQS